MEKTRITLWSKIKEWYKVAKKRKEIKEDLDIDPS